MSNLGYINLLDYHIPNFSKQTVFEGEELSVLELSAKVAQKLNEALDVINEGIVSIEGKEDSDNITNNRKLSPNGNFTGMLNGKSIFSVLADINDSLSLAKTIIDMVNNRESIGTIFDGGFFIDTEPSTFTIEGGLF